MKRALLLALALQACASAQPFVVSGESLKFAGETFVTTARSMDVAVTAGRITPNTYKQWHAFGVRFQSSYVLALRLWESARQGNDAALEGRVAAILGDFVTELGTYTALLLALEAPDGGT